MIKKILLAIFIVILIFITTTYFVGNYFYNYTFKKDLTLTEELVETQKESVDYRSVDYLKAEKWWQQIEKETLEITSFDNLKLKAYYLPAKEKTDKVVILAHGEEGSSITMALFSKYYYDEGFNILVPDNRCYGESEGNYIGTGFLDKQDYKSWIAQIVQKLGDNCKIVLHGISYGATSVTLLSSETTLPNVKCIIAEGGYSNLQELVNYRLNNDKHMPGFPIINAMNIISKQKQNYILSDVNVIDQVSKATIPIFYIHSQEDNFIPVYMAYKLSENTSSEKDLWVVDGNKHNTIFIENNEEYKTKVKEFYTKYIEQPENNG